MIELDSDDDDKPPRSTISTSVVDAVMMPLILEKVLDNVLWKQMKDLKEVNMFNVFCPSAALSLHGVNECVVPNRR